MASATSRCNQFLAFCPQSALGYIESRRRDMKNFVIALLLGIAVGGSAAWYFTKSRENKHVRHAQDKLGEKLAASHLTGGDSYDELARHGKVVRRQAHEISSA